MSDLLVLHFCSFALKKRVILSKNSMFLPSFYQVFDSFSLLLQFLCLRIAPVNLCSHRYLQKERPWAKRAKSYFTLLLTRNERFAWKTKEQISNPRKNKHNNFLLRFIFVESSTRTFLTVIICKVWTLLFVKGSPLCIPKN